MTIGVKIKKADGSWGGGSAPEPLVQDFTTSQDVIPPDGARFAWVELIAAGSAGWSGAGGGAYADGLFSVADMGASQPLTVGAAPAARAEGNGGATSFMTLTALGGRWGAPRGGGGQPTGAPNGSPGIYAGGNGGDDSVAGGTSEYGGGGGNANAAGGAGGRRASIEGRLQAGSGGNKNASATGPGGGCAGGSNVPAGNNVRAGSGAARFTWIF